MRSSFSVEISICKLREIFRSSLLRGAYLICPREGYRLVPPLSASTRVDGTILVFFLYSTGACVVPVE